MTSVTDSRCPSSEATRKPSSPSRRRPASRIRPASTAAESDAADPCARAGRAAAADQGHRVLLAPFLRRHAGKALEDLRQPASSPSSWRRTSPSRYSAAACSFSSRCGGDGSQVLVRRCHATSVADRPQVDERGVVQLRRADQIAAEAGDVRQRRLDVGGRRGIVEIVPDVEGAVAQRGGLVVGAEMLHRDGQVTERGRLTAAAPDATAAASSSRLISAARA